MKKILIILLLTISYSEDIFPNFNDVSKQLEFEKKRIYITDLSGERVNVSGGDSYTEMANPLGYIFLDEDPDYVVKNTPIETHYEYWSTFEIKQNNTKLSEIEFLKTIGLMDEANKIFKEYTGKLDVYNETFKTYENNVAEYYSKLNSTDTTYIEQFAPLEGALLNTGVLSTLWGVGALYYNREDYDLGSNKPTLSEKDAKNVLTIGVLSLFVNWILNKHTDVYTDKRYIQPFITYPNQLHIHLGNGQPAKHLKMPAKPFINKPIIKQTLSNKQIKSLAESYNRKIFNEIKRKK